MKKLIDVNVILRYLLGDNEKMAEAAVETIKEGAFTIPEVIAEVVYVLKGVYNIDRKEIAAVLTEFLQEIEIECKLVMKNALTLFSSTTLDFVDCILISRHHVLGEAIVTFDKKMSRYL
ncbi:MAG: PIN domain-containing protein [Anaerovoracaceae bacterium]